MNVETINEKQYKRYEVHKAINIDGHEFILCSITFATGSEYHNIHLWLTTKKDIDVTCKHCKKMLKHNPFVRRVNKALTMLAASNN